MVRRRLEALVVAALVCCEPVASLVPLTEIKAEPVELDAFAATLVGALEKLGLNNPIVHMIGTSDVEHAVDWSPACEMGATILMVGPNAVLHRAAGSCVTAIKGVYSKEVVEAAADPSQLEPDVFMLHHADIYTCSLWRRTLSKLLNTGKPIVLTVYCEFEGAAMDRIFRWWDEELSPQRVTKCSGGISESDGVIHKPTKLWGFQRNPHAHAPPRSCDFGKHRRPLAKPPTMPQPAPL